MRVGLVEPVPTKNQAENRTANNTSPVKESAEILPAQGWVLNDQGQVVLTAYDPTQKAVKRNQESFTGCAASDN